MAKLIPDQDLGLADVPRPRTFVDPNGESDGGRLSEVAAHRRESRMKTPRIRPVRWSVDTTNIHADVLLTIDGEAELHISPEQALEIAAALTSAARDLIARDVDALEKAAGEAQP